MSIHDQNQQAISRDATKEIKSTGKTGKSIDDNGEEICLDSFLNELVKINRENSNSMRIYTDILKHIHQKIEAHRKEIKNWSAKTISDYVLQLRNQQSNKINNNCDTIGQKLEKNPKVVAAIALAFEMETGM